MHFDIIIIGAGPGGYELAVHAARKGKEVLIVEAKALGGTCLNEGCIPTKCLCRNAEVLEDIGQAERYGISLGDYSFDLGKAVARKDEVVSKLSASIRTLLSAPGITLLEGTAKFVAPHTIAVETREGEKKEASADNIVIATGSLVKFLPIAGASNPGVVTSSEMLNLSRLPQRLCIIGGGVIGLEFASIFQTFGSEVTVVEYCKEILPNFDKDIAKRLRTSLKKKGITFKTGAAVTSIQAVEEGRNTVVYEEKGKQGGVDADLVLMAVGRTANIGHLDLPAAGVAFTPKGILVDENMQTNVPGVYAVGDANGLCQLAHAATFQGFRALSHILGEKSDIRLDIVPAAVFTVPEVAMVGLTEEACEEKGIPFQAHKSFYRANGKALAMDAEDGLVKILADEEGRILGAHILGAHAADLIHEIALLMQTGGTLHQLRTAIHAHPTLSEIVMKAANA